jgi:quercetin dioxygenase-like cupin family protein
MADDRMAASGGAGGWRTLQNRHNGEVLHIRRVVQDGVPRLELKGTLPPRQQGPPLHVHVAEDEEGTVTAGTLSAELDGKTVRLRTGERAAFPKGSAHRWWNDGDELLAFEGWATPVVDLDVYLAAIFDILNSGPANRPPMFYMAHLVWRHRKTQRVLLAPRWLQAVLLPVVVFIGSLSGKYRGTQWPGCPARFTAVPALDCAVRPSV